MAWMSRENRLYEEFKRASPTSRIDTPEWSVTGLAPRAVAASPNGAFLAVGTFFGTVAVLDARTGRCVRRHDHAYKSIESVDVSCDSRWVVSTSWEKFTFVVEIGGTTTIKTFVDEHYSYDARFSPDGRRIAVVSTANTVNIWSLDTNECVRRIPCHEAACYVEWIPNTNLIATCTKYLSGQLHVWDIESGALRRAIGFGDVVRSSVSPDGRRILTASGDGRTVHVWSVDSPEQDPVTYKTLVAGPHATEFRTTGSGLGFLGLAVSPNSKRFAVALDDRVLVWSFSSPFPLYVVPLRKDDNVWSVHFVGPHDDTIATMTREKAVEVWDLRRSFRMAILAALGHPGWTRFLLDKDGDHAIASRVVGFS